jgi:hypothetical protein
MMEAGDQAKLACGNIQLCAGLEAGIEASLHAVREVWDNDGFVSRGTPRPDDPMQNSPPGLRRQANSLTR